MSAISPQAGYDYWNDNEQTFRVLYTAIPTQLTLTDRLVLNGTPYVQYGYGNDPCDDVLDQIAVYSGSAGPYMTSIPNSDATGGSVMANFIDRQHRAGLVAKMTWTAGHNGVVFGDWYDYSNEADIQPTVRSVRTAHLPISGAATRASSSASPRARRPGSRPDWPCC